MNSEVVRYLAFDENHIKQTLNSWKTSFPEMSLIALVPEAEREKIPLLQSVCKQMQVTVTGAVFPTLITSSGWENKGLYLLCLAHTLPYCLLEARSTPHELAENIADCLALNDDVGTSEEKPTLFLIFDGMLPNVGQYAEALYYHLADSVHYAGVNAGSETFQPIPCLFDNSQIVQNGLLALLLPSGSGALLEHGYTPPETIITATSTTGNKIVSIDWQPAFTMYQTVIQQEYGISLTKENFYEYASHFPIGILQANQQVIVRIPVGIADDNAIICVGEIPENATLVFIQAPTEDLLNCTHQLVTRLNQEIAHTADLPLLTFYCAGRRMHLGQASATELQQLQNQSQSSTLVGALSLGEIGSRHLWEYPLFHNAAILCATWRAK